MWLCERDRRRYLRGKILLSLCFIVGIHFNLTDIEKDWVRCLSADLACWMHPSCLDCGPEQPRAARRMLNVKPTKQENRPYSHWPQVWVQSLKRPSCNTGGQKSYAMSWFFKKTTVKLIFGTVLTWNDWIKVDEFHLTFPIVVE